MSGNITNSTPPALPPLPPALPPFSPPFPPFSPPFSPPPPELIDPVVAATIFAVVTGLIGLVLLLVGHKFFRIFLGLVTFTIVAGAIGYVLLFHAISLPWWASSLIAVGMGLGAAVIAGYAVTVGLIVCAGISGGIVAALPIRLLAPETAGGMRIALIVVVGFISAIGVAYTVYKCRTPDDEDEDSMVPMTIAQRRQKKRALFMRDVLKAVVTSLLGSYFLVHAINQWWHESDDVRSMQAAALLDPVHVLPSCDAPCLGLEITYASLLLLGLLAQLCAICRAKPPPNSEFAELNEPMAPNGERAAAGGRSATGRGSQSELAQRMRFKYCGGRAGSQPTNHTAASVTSASSFERAGVLPAGSEARPRRGGASPPSATAPSPCTGPSWERPQPGANPWAAMGVAQAQPPPPSQPATPQPPPPERPSDSPSSSASVQPLPGPAGAAWPPPATPVWPPREE